MTLFKRHSKFASNILVKSTSLEVNRIRASLVPLELTKKEQSV